MQSKHDFYIALRAMFLPTSSSPRRPSFIVLAIAAIFALFALHSLYFGLYDPSSPILSYAKPAEEHQAPWLILTISTATHLQRRNMIRQTWQKLYSKTGYFDSRFVIADPGPLWHDLIANENATYGDLIMLDHENETHMWANTVKTLEALTYVVSHSRPYTFVSKMDEDSWLDAKTFWEVWLQPRIANNMVEGTYMGRPIQHDYPFKYACGQLYTLSWDMVTHLVELFAGNRIEDEHEDVLPGRLFFEAGVHYNILPLPVRVSFDYYDDQARGDGTAWAPDWQDPDESLYHAISAGSLNPHQLKEDDVFLRVAACFDENGIMTNDTVDWGRYMKVDTGW